ncbi:MAG: carbohydrate binding family 9 domain-containing protein [Saprospiraceae bacterium]|nr:carbohydrate binding family 9 domain-containing protein [Saprospiraceae bacterium]
MKIALPILALWLAFTGVLHAQNNNPNQESHQLRIQRASSPIVLDGKLEESVWKEAEIATDFVQKQPRDDVKAGLRTEMQVTYDDQFLYVAATCFDSTNHVVATLKRDIGFWDGDAVAVVLDPLNEATTGFMFGASPYGVQTEVLLGGGSGPENYSREWDNRWFVEVMRYNDRWTVEMAIPFKTLRYEAGKSSWGLNFTRNDKKNNRLDVWAPVPRQFWVIDLGYTGKMLWDEAPKKISSNVAVIPYVNTSQSKDFEEGEPADFSLAAGMDAKIALTSSLNLDLTINPDFSQVEVDQQVTNLTRFSIFLPERRTFFLENSDIFTNFGNPLVRPFFSRRIGLDEDGRAVPIDFGARLTGNVTGSTRIGLLNAQTRETEDQLAQNYTALSFNQRLFQRSTLKGTFTNRQGFDEGKQVGGDYGRNAGLEFEYQSLDGAWQAWANYHEAFKPGVTTEKSFWNTGASYTGGMFTATAAWVNVGTNYSADVGFVNRLENYDAVRDTSIRLGYRLFFLPLEWTFVPKNSKVLNQHSFGIENVITLDKNYGFVERRHELQYQFEFKNSSGFSIFANLNETDLRFPFSFTDGVPLTAGRYVYNDYGLEYSSDERKFLQYGTSLSTGSFYSGDISTVGAFALYRVQPWGNFSVEVEYNRLRFPDEHGEEEIWAISPRMEINFHRNLFWTTFLQYNTQADNFNINSRLQWRFAPMSDLFVVYTENYAVEFFGPKNRAMVLKLNYWLVL